MPDSLVDFIRKTMRDKGLTYKKVEEKSSPKIPTGSLSGLLNGPSPNPTLETLRGLATGLGVDPEQIARLAFTLPPLDPNPVIEEFIYMGREYSELDAKHRRVVVRQKDGLKEEIHLQLKHQKGLITFDDQGNPIEIGDGLMEGTNGR
jgi:transcriptional regulator with XRE-family HTH domain